MAEVGNANSGANGYIWVLSAPRCRAVPPTPGTFRLAIRAPNNGHSLSAIFPVSPAPIGHFGKEQWEQISGTRNPHASVNAIEAARFPPDVPIREEPKVLKKHYEDHVRHAAGVGCSRWRRPRQRKHGPVRAQQ